MCGIAGYLSKEVHGSQDAEYILREMLLPLYSRGPDDEGIYNSDNVVLGMRRLIVVDEIGGKQPMKDDHSGVVLVYNGELYNQKELRSELEEKGHKFRGYSDSEVILRAYLQYGVELACHLNGMFAFAIWDPRVEKLFIFRDHLGQKPLYFFSNEHVFVFGSDLRAVLAHPQPDTEINRHALCQYFQNRRIAAPLTIIKNILQLLPGRFLSIGKDCKVEEQEYWRPRYQIDDTLDEKLAADKFESIWQKSIDRHFISDVPVGVFLSGGIDSSLILSAAHKQGKPLRTFSIEFADNSYNESTFAKEVANLYEAEHHVISFSPDLLTMLNHWEHCYDQPFADPALFPLMTLAKESKDSITVALTGDGGDELFGGYQRYRSAILSRKIALMPENLRKITAASISKLAGFLPVQSPSRRKMEAVGRRISLINSDPEQEYRDQFMLFEKTECDKLLLSPDNMQMTYYNDPDIFASMMLQDMQNWLPNQMLAKTDRATMGFSLEARLPFLDRELLEFAMTIPTALHFKDGNLKHVLREVAKRSLPEHIATRKKHGFSVPTDSWLRKESKLVDELIEEGSARTGDYLNPTFVKQMWSRHKGSKANYGEKLLAIIIFYYWSRAYV